MAYSAADIANRFILLAHNAGTALTPMQLLKLVYLSHGWMLALYNKQLIEEDVEAWTYGPVIRDLYHDLKIYRSQPVINRLASKGQQLGGQELHLIDQVYQIYGKRSGPQLSALTHMPNTPWDITRKSYGAGAIIPQKLIKKHFVELSKRAQ